MKEAAAAVSMPVDGFMVALQLAEEPFYRLLIETPERDERRLRSLLEYFENGLRLQNIEYAEKRESQRLGEPTLRLLENGFFEQIRKKRVQQGVPDGQYKLPHLTKDIEQFGDFRYITEVKAAGAGAE
jgi:hypothetical protein